MTEREHLRLGDFGVSKASSCPATGPRRRRLLSIPTAGGPATAARGLTEASCSQSARQTQVLTGTEQLARTAIGTPYYLSPEARRPPHRLRHIPFPKRSALP